MRATLDTTSLPGPGESLLAPIGGFVPTEDSAVLVLGSTGHPRGVTAFAWDEIPSDLNVTDFDLIIVNLVPLLESEASVTTPEFTHTDEARWGRFLFAANKTLVVIGEPWTKMGGPFAETLPADWFLPGTLAYKREPGRVVRPLDPAVVNYLRRVKSWSYFWTGDWELRGDWRTRWLADTATGDVLSVEMTPLAENGAGHAVAVQFEFHVEEVDGWNETSELVNRSSPVIWLPQPTEVSATEGIDALLAELGLRPQTDAPRWARAFTLPRERELAEHAETIEETLAEERKALREVDEERRAQARLRALLYAGDHELEPIVHDALRSLGAEVEEPATNEKEDGRLQDPAGRGYVLEVKSGKGGLTLTDVRQLEQWTDEANEEDQETEWKPLLVINAFRHRRPEERPDAVGGPAGTRAAALEQCVITTPQLYAAFAADQRGELDRTAFWALLGESKGLVDLTALGLPPLRATGE